MQNQIYYAEVPAGQGLDQRVAQLNKDYNQDFKACLYIDNIELFEVPDALDPKGEKKGVDHIPPGAGLNQREAEIIKAAELILYAGTSDAIDGIIDVFSVHLPEYSFEKLD